MLLTDNRPPLTAEDVWVAHALTISVENARLIQGKTRGRALARYSFKGGTFVYWALRGIRTPEDMTKLLG